MTASGKRRKRRIAVHLRRLISISVLASASLAGASMAHANLLTNPSFEAGAFVNQGNDTMSLAAGSTAITGWTVVTDTAAWIGPSNPFSLAASDGDYFLDLSNYQPGGPFAGMTQVITTVAGATYSLSFDLGGSNIWGRPDGITASAAGTSVTFTTPSTGTNNDWYHESMEFVATSTSTTINLQGQSGVNYIGLDNAGVELVSLPVPEPSTWLMTMAGLALLGRTVRQRLVR
jgi:hypothetical protein